MVRAAFNVIRRVC